MSAGRRGSKTLSRLSKLKDQTKLAAATPEEATASQRTLDRVTKERDELKRSLDASHKDNAKLKQTISHIMKKIMDTINPTPFLTGSEKDASDVSEEEVTEMLGQLVAIEHNVSYETRLEELETRITLLNSELGKLLKLKLSLEGGLKELDACQNLESMRQKVKILWLQSCSTKMFAKDALLENGEDITEDSVNTGSFIKTNAVHNLVNLPSSVQINLRKVEITPPCGQKVGGNTHISNMRQELKQMVIQDLSLYKGCGCDWRLFAQRVGIAEQMIQQWHEMKLPQPMKNVLTVWASSPAATVRMLHRHLVSPQMKCVILGKRISDYYEVD